jgi:hypothetical protein
MTKKPEDNPFYQEIMGKFKQYEDELKEKRKGVLENVDKEKKLLEKKAKLDVIEKKIKLKKDLHALKETTQLNVMDFISDNRFIKEIDKIRWWRLIKKFRMKLQADRMCLIIMHRQNNNDVAKFFPIENHIVDVNGKKYLFNPVHFRYINGFPVLYFYHGNPFAKMMYVSENYSEPTISSEAFTSILKSKFVMDAVKGEEEGKMKGILAIITIILLLVSIVVNFLVFNAIANLEKILQGG